METKKAYGWKDTIKNVFCFSKGWGKILPTNDLSEESSFEDLRTVDGILCETFKEAATRMNLLEDDNEWDKALEEARDFQMPHSLRELFAYVCLYGQPSNANALYERYKVDFIEDYIKQKYTLEEAECLALEDIAEILATARKALTDFSLREPWLHVRRNRNADPASKTREEYEEIGKEMFQSMDHAQAAVFTEILNATKSIQPYKHCFFVDGPGGSGELEIYFCIQKAYGNQYGNYRQDVCV